MFTGVSNTGIAFCTQVEHNRKWWIVGKGRQVSQRDEEFIYKQECGKNGPCGVRKSQIDCQLIGHDWSDLEVAAEF